MQSCRYISPEICKTQTAKQTNVIRHSTEHVANAPESSGNGLRHFICRLALYLVL